MEVESINVASLLQEVNKTIVKHEALAKERGEDFNLFSIMGMENNETYTHSAMIAALLNPKGNHYKGVDFLKLFLQEIEYNYENEDLVRTKVFTEFYVGKIDEGYENGGFIDILIEFSSGKTIAIENKIYAKDQHRQLYRYSKYNPLRSSIFYLSLFGHTPHPHSYCTLNLEDIIILSYRKHIIEWLNKCLTICQDGSVLFTSIKQYQILLKKLTNMMDKSKENEVRNAVLNNLYAAEYVASNYNQIVYNIREHFRQSIITELKNSLPSDKYLVTPGHTPDYHYSQIWIKSLQSSSDLFEFGVESFSGKGNENGNLFVGIINRSKEDLNNLSPMSPDKYYNKWWPILRVLKTLEDNPIHLNSKPLLAKLGDADSEVFKKFLSNTVTQIINFVNDKTPLLHDISNRVKTS